MIGWASWGTQTPSTTPLHPKKWNAHFWITFNFWWLAGLVNGLKPPLPPLQPKKWNATFWITFNFWWSAGWVNGLKPHPPPLSSQRNEMFLFGLCSASDVGQTGQWTQTPSTSPLQPIKWNVSFWIMFTSDDQPGWSMDSNPIHHPSPPQKNEILIFGLRSTSDDQLGWSMDSNPIHHPSAANKMKCSFFDYVQILVIGLAGQWIQTPSASSLQPIKWNATFWIMFNFWRSAGLVNGLKTHLPPLSSQ